MYSPQTASLSREFQWSSSFEGHVLGAYYYGFLLTVMLAGYVDRALGAVRTIALGLAGGAVVNLLTPALTRQHGYLLVALRVLAGCANVRLGPRRPGLRSVVGGLVGCTVGGWVGGSVGWWVGV